MLRKCDTCGREYEARRKDSRTCSPTCRKRRGRGAKPASDSDGLVEKPLVVATRRELEAAGELDTRLGQQALALAERMSGSETNAGIAALSRELCAVMAAATGSKAPGQKAKADYIDELRVRRDAKRGPRLRIRSTDQTN